MNEFAINWIKRCGLCGNYSSKWNSTEVETFKTRRRKTG